MRSSRPLVLLAFLSAPSCASYYQHYIERCDTGSDAAQVDAFCHDTYALSQAPVAQILAGGTPPIVEKLAIREGR